MATLARLARRKPLGAVGGVIVVAMLVMAAFAERIAPYGYDDSIRGARMKPPGAAHWLGTDNLSRDMWSRIVYGARVSITVGFLTVALALAPDATELDELAASIPPQAKLAVLLGTEGTGLSKHWSDGAAVRTRIPMSAGIDSLNVAAAAAIACYALSARGVTGQSSG